MYRLVSHRAEALACEVKEAWEKMTVDPDPSQMRTHELRRWRSSFGPSTDSTLSLPDSWKGVVLYRIWDDASQSNPVKHKHTPGISFITHSAKPYPHTSLRDLDSRANALHSHMNWQCYGEASPFISTTSDVNWIYSEGLRRALEGIRGPIRVTALSARIRAAYGLPIVSAEKSAKKYGVKRSNWLAGNLGWDADDDTLLPLAVLEKEVLDTKGWKDIKEQEKFERWVQKIADEVEEREEKVLQQLRG